MRPGETLIEMARRHVAEGEAHVLKQRDIVERLTAQALPADTARALLLEFESTLEDHRRSLARIEKEQSQGRRDLSGNLLSDED